MVQKRYPLHCREKTLDIVVSKQGFFIQPAYFLLNLSFPLKKFHLDLQWSSPVAQFERR